MRQQRASPPPPPQMQDDVPQDVIITDDPTDQFGQPQDDSTAQHHVEDEAAHWVQRSSQGSLARQTDGTWARLSNGLPDIERPPSWPDESMAVGAGSCSGGHNDFSRPRTPGAGPSMAPRRFRSASPTLRPAITRGELAARRAAASSGGSGHLPGGPVGAGSISAVRGRSNGGRLDRGGGGAPQSFVAAGSSSSSLGVPPTAAAFAAGSLPKVPALAQSLTAGYSQGPMAGAHRGGAPMVQPEAAVALPVGPAELASRLQAVGADLRSQVLSRARAELASPRPRSRPATARHMAAISAGRMAM